MTSVESTSQTSSAPEVEPERASFESAFFSSSASPVFPLEFVCGVLAMGLWFIAFGGGILIGTAPYIAVIQSGSFRPADVIFASLMILLFWTVTNVGTLACVASFLGAFAARTRFASGGYHEQARTEQRPRGVATFYAGAVLRGFSVYGLVLAGMLVLATEFIVTPSQGQYVRLAATISMMSFYVGYDPEVFANLLSRVKQFLDVSPSRSR